LTPQADVPILFQCGIEPNPFPLSRLNVARDLITVGCAYCKREHTYYPTGLMQQPLRPPAKGMCLPAIWNDEVPGLFK
jgi:hypothetical protein